MSNPQNEPLYGSTSGPQDGEIRPIPTPQPPAYGAPQSASPAPYTQVPPAPYGQVPPDPAAADRQAERAARVARRRKGEAIVGVGSGVATVIFLALGFAFGAWWWAWIVFLIPGIIRQYYWSTS